MATEQYINHPNFGLLYRICHLEDSRELYATLYAQRLFFLVALTEQSARFEPISRVDARMLVDSRLRQLRRSTAQAEYRHLELLSQQTF
jgi:PII interaction protein X